MITWAESEDAANRRPRGRTLIELMGMKKGSHFFRPNQTEKYAFLLI
jgi:hypothetical protein